MNISIRKLKSKRRYTEEFKRRVVNEFESGRYSVLQLSRLYGIPGSGIYLWIYKYSNFNEKGVRIVEMKDSSAAKLKALEQKLSEMERLIGQKQIKIDYLEKMIDIARTELDIDIKKNYGTPPSGGSGKTAQK